MMLGALACAAIFASVAWAQSAFEVASIHPVNPKDPPGPSGCTTTTGLMRCTNVTLKRCIVSAYRVTPDRVLGGPDWMDTDRFQITAKSEQPAGDPDLMRMFQALLADRFKLALHRQSRKTEAMVLEVAKTGSKLEPAADDSRGGYHNAHDRIQATEISMDRFTEVLSRDLKLPVVDRTGLAGRFTFTLRWNPEVTDGLQRDEAADALRAEMASAILRQLGLILRFQKVPLEMLVIDHAQKPGFDN